ncbi:MAG: ABC transporter permease [Thermomicrobiales bacterium]
MTAESRPDPAAGGSLAADASASSGSALGTVVRRRQRFRPRTIPVFVYLFGAIVAAIALAAIFAPVVAPHDPLEQSLRTRLDPPFWMEEGSRDHLLGTDRLGRDVLSRIIYGTRTSLLIGFAALLIGGTIGTTLGLIAGYFGRSVDEIVMTVADIQLAFPFVLLAIAVVAVLGSSLTVLVVVVGLSGWVTYARIARGCVLTLREIGFVEAVRSVGASHGRIMLRHILPNTVSPLVVLATLELARLIILEATLSFLGLGVQPPTPSWGGMIGDGREYLGSDTGWWISIFPGGVLFVTALGVSRVGDWIRDVLDPTMRHA